MKNNKMHSHAGLIPNQIKDWYNHLIAPIFRLFEKGNIHPNTITILSFVLSLFAASLLWFEYLRWGGIFILISGTCDILDGAIARAANKETKFGALLDSTLDRYSELAVYFGILVYFLKNGYALNHPIIPAIFLSISGSMIVSYVRARAEGLGFNCRVGIMQRPERVVLLGFGAIFGEMFLFIAIIIIALFANVTAIQRLLHIKNLS